MIDEALKVAKLFLEGRTPLLKSEVIKVAEQILSMGRYDIDKEYFIRAIESFFSITDGDDARFLENPETYKPWLIDFKSEKDQKFWKFWNRYHEYLTTDKLYSEYTITKLDKLTDRILDNLFNPSIMGTANKKGLVVGHVQSGKTSNYIGLVNKAADAGFGLIIILAGIHNNLRSQTQLRVDEGFLGFDTQFVRAIDKQVTFFGVGKKNTALRSSCVAHSLTSSSQKGDFNPSRAKGLGFNFNTIEPIVAVCKKNTKVLRDLYEWLLSKSTDFESEGNKIIDKSVLIIDDEADNASINTSKDPDKATQINKRIRDILNLFTKKAYVGYTATPFANVFIPIKDDDLFPKDFIINIPAPSNYIGPSKIFDFNQEEDKDNSLPLAVIVDDYTRFFPDKHKKDDLKPNDLPVSLKKAIRCFIITCAIRAVRKQNGVHNSMLIHVSRYISWQREIVVLVANILDEYRLGISQNDPGTYNLFLETFETDETNYSSYTTVSNEMLKKKEVLEDPGIKVHSWDEVKDKLYGAVTKIQILELNGNSEDSLCYYNYDNGLSAIVIGADKLSRGMTLEGLSISYFLRASKMYDTLMQMGRWFGYRSGYLDLCRLFLSSELYEWFSFITIASDELREEFDIMTKDNKAKPEDYALRVRSHPGVLQISASNKLRSAVYYDTSHGGRLAEPSVFRNDKAAVESNFRNFEFFCKKLKGNPEVQEKDFLWRDVNVEYVLIFLSNYLAHELVISYAPARLCDYIRQQNKNNYLLKWRVAIMNKKTPTDSKPICINNEIYDIGLYVRENAAIEKDRFSLKKAHLISPNHEFVDLSSEEIARAWELTRKEKEDPKYPNGKLVRTYIRTWESPLFLLYLIDPIASNATTEKDLDPFVGYAISFPGDKMYESIKYAIPKGLLPNLDFNDDFEDSDYDED